MMTFFRVSISTMRDGILYQGPNKTKGNFNFSPASQKNLTSYSPPALNMQHLTLSAVNIGTTLKY